MAKGKNEDAFSNAVEILSAAGSIISGAASDAVEKGLDVEAEYMRKIQSKLFGLEVLFDRGLVKEVKPRKREAPAMAAAPVKKVRL